MSQNLDWMFIIENDGHEGLRAGYPQKEHYNFPFPIKFAVSKVYTTTHSKKPYVPPGQNLQPFT